jgi:hypothetical protein
MPPTRKLIAALFWTSRVPDCTTVDAPFGPVTVHATALICTPLGRVS